MEHYTVHSHNHSSMRNYLERVKIHRNSKNILSILFDEVNFCEEKFDILKKELHTVHRSHHSAYNEPCNDVFSSLT